MVTLFAIPKAFVGHTGVIQHNSIASWKTLHPEFQIILFGDEAGIAEAALEHGVEHVPEVKRNEYGTPVLSTIFAEVEPIARFPILCYVNSDIMLLDDFNDAVRRVKDASTFLMVGQRWNLDVTERLDFSRPAVDRELRSRTMENGALAQMWAMDYFVYPKGSLKKLPEFAIGRPGWDNWMLYNARMMNTALINSSLAVMAIHQNHPPAYATDGAEAHENGQAALSTGMHRPFTLLDATHLLTPSSLESADLRRLEETTTDVELLPQFRSMVKRLYADRTLSTEETFFLNHILAGAYWYEATNDILMKDYLSAFRNMSQAGRLVPRGYSWERFMARALKEVGIKLRKIISKP